MRISNRDNYSSIKFQAGLTTQMKLDIVRSDVKKIESEFHKHGMVADFKNNRIVAWCSLKCLEIIKELNRRFGLNLGLPTGVCVEDFSKLHLKHQEACGACNVMPTKLYKNFDVIVPQKAIFFNEYAQENFPGGNMHWNHIDELTTLSKKQEFSPSDFFLEPFLHEFMHVVHEEHLLNKLGSNNLVERLVVADLKENRTKFDNKYYQILYKNCCYYATSSPMEAIACDLTSRVINCLDKNTIKPTSNFVVKSPYREFTFKEKLLAPFKESEYDRIIKRFWDGNFK